MMAKIILIVSLLCPVLSMAQSIGLIGLLNKEKNRIENCYSYQQNDTLFIGNSFIERRFRWNKGNIISCDITSKTSGKTIQVKNGQQPDFYIKGLTYKDNNSSYSSKKIDANTIVPAHLRTEIVTVYEGLEVKQVFKIFPSSMGIACEYYLKRTSNNLSFHPEDIVVEQLNIDAIHWCMEAIEFIDNTDRNNTYVKKEKLIPFHTNKYVGNILYLSDVNEDKGIYILKEAPCSSIQNNYPGYDFVSTLNRNSVNVKSIGLGIRPEDLIDNEWIKTFGYVIGVHNTSDFEKKVALRSYQSNIRILKPGRDDMMMVNTWGDRNRDTKLSEKFILDELLEANKFGFTHYQIDDGWQQGLSMNSGHKGERLWDQWSLEDWQPHRERFPNGFEKIIECADSLGIKIGLWFHPSNENEYKNWKQDADIVISLYRQFGITNIKIDGIKLPTKKADINLQHFFDKVLKETNNEIVFNVDATADNRYGYHYNNYLGNIYLENRYTDWKNYYPYQTLRNIWMLSEYVPLQRIQLEFLNKWRNEKIYGNDPFAPARYSFDYLFAITMPCQPLAFFETTGLPEEANKTINLFHNYKTVWNELHRSQIFPIGNQPNGIANTGFQFLTSDKEGYLLIFRELNDTDQFYLSTMFVPGQTVKFTKVYGDGDNFTAKTDYDGRICFKVRKANAFCLYKYKTR